MQRRSERGKTIQIRIDTEIERRTAYDYKERCLTGTPRVSGHDPLASR